MGKTNDQVAHLWANQSKPHASSSNGHFSFDGPLLYSYSTPIGRLILAADGTPKGALLSQRTYSATTGGKHLPAAWNALRASLPNFAVPDVGHSPDGIDHMLNLKALFERYEGYKQKMLRCQELHGYREDMIRHAAHELHNYCHVFDLTDPYVHIDPEKDIAGIKEAREEREARLNTPERAAKRERDRARRGALKAKREAEAREAALASIAEKIDLWRAGHPYAYLPYNAPMMLRLKPGDPNSLQTSRGAVVPVEAAKRVFRIAQECRDKGKAFRPTLVPVKIGDFRLDGVDANGTIHAGCHTIPWEESERMAATLGLVEPLQPQAAEG